MSLPMPMIRRTVACRALTVALVLGALTAAACSETRSSAGDERVGGAGAGAGADEGAAGTEEPTEIESVVVIGDSLTEGSANLVEEALVAAGFEPLLVDGSSGRRSVAGFDNGPSSGVSAMESAKADGHNPDAWVIALGTNDVMHYSPDELPDVIGELLATVPDGAPLVWVDVYLRDFEAEESAFNDALGVVLADRPHTVIAEWTASAWQEGLMSGDGIHPTTEGNHVFAATIAQALTELSSSS